MITRTKSQDQEHVEATYLATILAICQASEADTRPRLCSIRELADTALTGRLPLRRRSCRLLRRAWRAWKGQPLGDKWSWAAIAFSMLVLTGQVVRALVTR